MRIFDTMPLFRVIYTSRTHFRLMETAGGDPVAWLVQMPTVPGDPNSVLIAVRDIVSLLDDVPVHRGIELSVLTEGSDIDDAIARAFSNADTLLTVLSASSRAPAEPLRPFVAFDVSPDLVERTLVQWFPDLDYPIGKTPVPHAAFDALLQRLPTATEKAGSRLMLSLAWHRQALLATEPLLRFLTLWISFEALEPRLAEHYSVDSRGFQGLRRLAAEHGCSSEDITIALGVRQDLFHARRVLPADVRTRAQSLLPTLERLVVAGWLTVLGAPGELAGFPGSAVTPYPVQLTVKAPITGADPTAMTSDTVPYFVGRPKFRRLAPESAGAVTLSIETKMKLQNAAESGEPEVRLMGPAGPNVFVPESGTLSVRPDC